MYNKLPKFYSLDPEVQNALQQGDPVVALESTVITHGLPYPENITLAEDMEAVIRTHQATPAAVAVIEGKIRVGLDQKSLQALAKSENLRKVSVRDYAPAIAQRASGGTTVAGTLLAAETVGIRIFATGGIGGVHRDAPFDISTDLSQLAKSPVVVVCAGAKAILDLPATIEQFETLGVPVIGYQTDEFPAFYSRESGLPVSARADTPEEAAAIAQAHWKIAGRRGLLIAAPPPVESAIPAAEVEAHIQQALREAQQNNISGQAVTPFLLARVSQLSQGESLKANLALLKNNARIAAQISHFLYEKKGKKSL
jgi:pseudouridine-5'-phosphate glycosidase